MRRIGVVTVGRSDYGIYRPILEEISLRKGLELHLIVAGMHLDERFGSTIRLIESDGFRPAAIVPIAYRSDDPCGIARSMGEATAGFAECWARTPLDMLFVVGDRFEMHAAAVAALPFKLPVAHVHGGEVTRGAIDESLRHSLTKLSHLHFVATAEYGDRVIQMGEAPWRVHVVGAPALDELRGRVPMGAAELKRLFGVRLDPPPLLITYHPVTLEYEQTEHHITELLAALDKAAVPAVFTLPNADTHNSVIRKAQEAYVRSHPTAMIVENFGNDAYFGMMRVAAAMVGNSSSGIIEAPSFALPVVNVGTRQEGRVRGANVIDVAEDRDEIFEGICKACRPEFRRMLSGVRNPYDRGGASSAIGDTLENIAIDDRLLRKVFYDATTTSVCSAKSYSV